MKTNTYRINYKKDDIIAEKDEEIANLKEKLRHQGDILNNYNIAMEIKKLENLIKETHDINVQMKLMDKIRQLKLSEETTQIEENKDEKPIEETPIETDETKEIKEKEETLKLKVVIKKLTM